MRDAVSGYQGESVYTLDFEEYRLEAELKRGGFGESGFEAVELVGVEYIREAPTRPFDLPFCPMCLIEHEMPQGIRCI